MWSGELDGTRGDEIRMGTPSQQLGGPHLSQVHIKVPGA